MKISCCLYQLVVILRITRSTNVFGSRGNYGVNTPGVAHERNYLCGNENLDIHLGIVMKELVHAEVNRTIDNVLAFKNSFLRLIETRHFKES